MPSQYGDAVYWRTAACNARTMAETFGDQAARLAMQEIAIKLEAIARRAHAQDSGLRAVEGDNQQKAG